MARIHLRQASAQESRVATMAAGRDVARRNLCQPGNVNGGPDGWSGGAVRASRRDEPLGKDPPVDAGLCLSRSKAPFVLSSEPSAGDRLPTRFQPGARRVI